MTPPPHDLEHLWKCAPVSSAPAEAEVQIWCASLAPAPDKVERLAALLSPDERTRAGKFRFERDCRRYVVGRGTLRVLLGAYLNESPAQLRFGYEANGKPILVGAGRASGLQFNVSHTDDVGLLGFTRGSRIGVDVERVRPIEDLEQLAARFFSSSEKAELEECSPADRVEAFYRCWTRKEAVIKATGEGLSRRLDEFDVSLAADRPARLLRLQGEPDAPLRWTLHELRPVSGYIAAVAVEGPTSRIRARRIS